MGYVCDIQHKAAHSPLNRPTQVRFGSERTLADVPPRSAAAFLNKTDIHVRSSPCDVRHPLAGSRLCEVSEIAQIFQTRVVKQREGPDIEGLLKLASAGNVAKTKRVSSCRRILGFKCRLWRSQ